MVVPFSAHCTLLVLVCGNAKCMIFLSLAGTEGASAEREVQNSFLHVNRLVVTMCCVQGGQSSRPELAVQLYIKLRGLRLGKSMWESLDHACV